jgi:hypothetical protein
MTGLKVVKGEEAAIRIRKPEKEKNNMRIAASSPHNIKIICHSE